MFTNCVYSMEINMKMKFAERLKELRKENGYTQVMLAEALGLSKGTVAMWETGKRTPDYEIINIIYDRAFIDNFLLYRNWRQRNSECRISCGIYISPSTVIFCPLGIWL